MNAVAVKEEKMMVEEFNKKHSPGDEVLVKDENGEVVKKTLRSKAFLGKGKHARIMFKDRRGFFGLKRVINSVVITDEKKTEKPKVFQPKNDPRQTYYRLKDHLTKEIEKNGKVEITKITINLMFPNIHLDWGILKPEDQFKAFIGKYGMKVDNHEEDSKIVITKS
jgi:hypothetical protein